MRAYVIEMISGDGEVLQVGMSLNYEVAKEECKKINQRYKQLGWRLSAEIITYHISNEYTEFNS